MIIYALVSNQGTALADAALCGECYGDPDERRWARSTASAYEDWDQAADFVEATGNDQLACLSCGRAS
jgi:hypothetical protein